MKSLYALVAASSILLAAGAAQALTIENKSSAPAAVTVSEGDKSQSVQVEANGRQTAQCSAQCTVEYQGEKIEATNDDHLVISTEGKLEKSDAMQDQQTPKSD